MIILLSLIIFILIVFIEEFVQSIGIRIYLTIICMIFGLAFCVILSDYKEMKEEQIYTYGIE